MDARPIRSGAVAAVAFALLTAPGLVSPPVQAATSEGSGRYQTGELTFSPLGSGRATGMEVRIDYVNPDDPDAKPPAVRRVVEVFPRGSRIDTRAPKRCTATDAELMAQGADACPAGSVVGTGFIKLDTGVEGPERYLKEDVTFLNNTHELIYLNQDRTSGERVVTRARVERRRLISEVPFLPGTPPDGAAVDRVRADFPRLVRGPRGERRAYLRIPRRCPDRGYWVNKIRFTYDDGTKQTERTRNRCA